MLVLHCSMYSCCLETSCLSVSFSIFLCVCLVFKPAGMLSALSLTNNTNKIGSDVLCWAVLYDIDPVCRLDSFRLSSIYTAFILVPMSGLLTTPASQPTKPLGEVYLWQGGKLMYILSYTCRRTHTLLLKLLVFVCMCVCVCVCVCVGVC